MAAWLHILGVVTNLRTRKSTQRGRYEEPATSLGWVIGPGVKRVSLTRIMRHRNALRVLREMKYSSQVEE